ncbi:MAG: dehydrogenase [Sphaerisporangium sp.]|nr:dehydrogenase [Sphaerisporangium sp.]
MRAVVMHKTGGPEVLGLEEIPTPVPGPGELLLRTEAVGIPFGDLGMRAGAYLPVMPASLPTVPGSEAAGTVMEVGEGVDTGLAGSRVAVMMMTGVGTYAEYVAVPVEMSTPIPEGVSAEDAVAVAVQGATALTLLRTAGAKVKRERARELGADIVVDHRDPSWPGQVRDALQGATLDIVFESVAGASARELLDLMTPGTGRMLYYGRLGGEPAAVTPDDLLYRGLTLIGCGGLAAWAKRVAAARTDVLCLLAEGRLHPLVDSVLPLADAATAHRRIENRETMGKIVLTP